MKKENDELEIYKKQEAEYDRIARAEKEKMRIQEIERQAREEKKAKEKRKQALCEEITTASDVDYALDRREIAKKHGVPVGTCDKIRESFQKTANEKSQSSTPFQMPEPWPEPVEASELYNIVKERIGQYVVMDEAQLMACTLYIMLTYCADFLRLFPLLAIQSAIKRCGKTRLQQVCSLMINKGISLSSISEAALYRVVEKYHPTLLIDEIDTLFTNRKNDRADAIRGLLNAGHDRSSSKVWRCDGEENDVRAFDVFGPKVLSGIGKLPDTLTDRSIIIKLKRKLQNEKVKRFSLLDDQNEWINIRARLLRWSKDNGEKISEARPELPKELNDRAYDNWMSLIAVADMAGIGDDARQVAYILSANTDEETQNYGLELLKDIHNIYATGHFTDGKILTEDLIQKLCEIEESPWETFSRGKKITGRRISGLLRSYGIKSLSEPLRLNGKRGRGYDAEDFKDSWERYLNIDCHTSVTCHRSETCNPCQKTENTENLSQIVTLQSVTRDTSVTKQETNNSLYHKEIEGKEGDLSHVTDKKGGAGEEQLFPEFQ
jgi:putative DNA primase/helicase